jgi:hypothetical protein
MNVEELGWLSVAFGTGGSILIIGSLATTDVTATDELVLVTGLCWTGILGGLQLVMTRRGDAR